MIRKKIVDEIGGFRSEYNGAQDFDIILKATEKAQTIVHIPKVLYHWRISQESTALNMEAKPYAIEAGKKAVEAHLERTNKKGTVFFGTNIGTYGIDYEVEGNPKVTILIPNKDNMDLLDRCVTSILEKTTYSNYESVIIENNSETEEIFETNSTSPFLHVLLIYKRVESNLFFEYSSFKINLTTFVGRG